MVWSIETDEACRIVTHFNNGATTAHLATKYSHSKKAIQNLLSSYYEEYDKVPQKGKRPRRRIGKNSNITVEHRSILDNIFDEDPSYYIREARDLLNQKTGTNTGADYFGLWFFILISILHRLFNMIFVLRVANSQS